MTSKQVDPAAAVAFNKANAAFRAGQYEQALTQAEEAIGKDTTLTVAFVMKARCLTALGRLPQAQAAYEAALALAPDDFSAHLERGNILRRLRDDAAAEQSYGRAVASRPNDHRGHLALAILLAQAHRALADPTATDQAAIHYHRALRAAPKETVTIHSEIGKARLAGGNIAGALEAFRQAWISHRLIAQGHSDPDKDAMLLMDMAGVYLRLGLEADGKAALERAARTEKAAILKQIAKICYDANLWQEGIAVLHRAVELNPNNVDVHLALTDMQSLCWQLDDAQASLARAQQVAEVVPEVVDQLSAKIATSKGDVETALLHYKAMTDKGVATTTSSLAMTSLYSDKISGPDVAALHRDLFKNWGKDARPDRSFSKATTRDNPLRIGMVTSDLHKQHPVNLFMQPVLARWPQDRLPLTVYFTGKSYDAETRLAKTRVTQWREVSHDQLPAQIAADQVDVLIDLAGHTSVAAMQMFAKRMAPVQISYLGYPGSTGVPNIDWLIGDATVAPLANADQFSEQIAHMPHAVFCFAPEADHPQPVFGPNMLTRPLTFGSFNNVPKLTEDTISLWARVLTEVPGSNLLLKAPSFQDAGVVARYTEMFKTRGVTPDRIILRGPTPLDAMMQEYADVDIGLDPLHYNGGTTSLQAMWMGVPVLTLTGDKFASRMGTSFMKAAGLQDYVATDPDDFVAAAKRAASDRHGLLALKAGLRDRLLTLPAWDIDLFTRDFTALLEDIWARS